MHGTEQTGIDAAPRRSRISLLLLLIPVLALIFPGIYNREPPMLLGAAILSCAWQPPQGWIAYDVDAGGCGCLHKDVLPKDIERQQ